MKRWCLVIVLVACKSKSTKPADDKPAKSAGLPPLYADLFVTDKHWVFQANVEEPGGGGGHSMICTVDEVKRNAAVAAASVHCVSDGGDVSEPRQARGIFVGKADGLWQTCVGYCKAGIGDLEAIKLDPAKKLLPGTSSIESTDEDGTKIFQRTAPHGRNGACITTFVEKVDGAGWILCLEPGKGIVGGRGFDHPKPTTVSTFGDSPAI